MMTCWMDDEQWWEDSQVGKVRGERYEEVPAQYIHGGRPCRSGHRSEVRSLVRSQPGLPPSPFPLSPPPYYPPSLPRLIDDSKCRRTRSVGRRAFKDLDLGWQQALRGRRRKSKKLMSSTPCPAFVDSPTSPLPKLGWGGRLTVLDRARNMF